MVGEGFSGQAERKLFDFALSLCQIKYNEVPSILMQFPSILIQVPKTNMYKTILKHNKRLPEKFSDWLLWTMLQELLKVHV